MSLVETFPMDSPEPSSAEVPLVPPAAAPDAQPEPAEEVVAVEPAPPVDLVAIALAAVERAVRLPRGVRAQFQPLLTADRLTTDAQGRACVPLEDALAAFEASLPTQWLSDPHTLPAASHPGGEAFFTGAAEELSDERADAIARAQLERAGFLRGAGS